MKNHVSDVLSSVLMYCVIAVLLHFLDPKLSRAYIFAYSSIISLLVLICDKLDKNEN